MAVTKKQILDAWIMEERLSEGDINPRKMAQEKTRRLQRLNAVENGDYYSAISEYYWRMRGSNPRRSQAGVEVFFDVFDFNDVVSILHKKYTLPDKYDEINYGKKFSLLLRFDENLTVIPDELFFTVSAYIRYKKQIPSIEEFIEYEDELKAFIDDIFEISDDENKDDKSDKKDKNNIEGKADNENADETDAYQEDDKYPKIFNLAFRKLIDKLQTKDENCYVAFCNDLNNADTNLHSFFIKDLEAARKCDTNNLKSYLFGGNVSHRQDLDSKSTSPKFNPAIFEKILNPENYPLGKFPSNTVYAPAFMQQVAINLATKLDNNTIRSVNGPPGTGKTTLLKDIFAHLAVQQAYDIAVMNNKKIKARVQPAGLTPIGYLPDKIAANNIIVASSNNGAVQNIVNELPLKKEIDKDLLPELLEADYFVDLANSTLEEIIDTSSKKETGKNKKTATKIRVVEKEQKDFWGLYSLEGGRAGNMKNLLEYCRQASLYLRTECESEPEIYDEFLKSHKEVRNMRATAMKKAKSGASGAGKVLDMNLDYNDLQMSNPWFTQEYRIAQSRLFIMALRVRRQFLLDNYTNLKAAIEIWKNQDKLEAETDLIAGAWHWINLAIPVISSTFASFGYMCRNLGPNTLGHLFIDEAGQAVPQAAVGAILRSKHVMVVGDPAQIKPVITLSGNILTLLSRVFKVGEKYLSDSASTQTLVDAASMYGYYRDANKDDSSWIGIPLWVHRRCEYPMFDIANELSYDGLMVQGNDKYGRTGWFDIGGKAKDKYVEEQGNFLVEKIRELSEMNIDILDHSKKDVIYVITPFRNVAYMLSEKLDQIGFTRWTNPGRSGGARGKATNIGTIHTFQGKEAPIVFVVLGADMSSTGAARWAVGEPNMMNVAATRARKEFYVVGDKELYKNLNSEVALTTIRIINLYGKRHPELVDNGVTIKRHSEFAGSEAVSMGYPEIVDNQVPAMEFDDNTIPADKHPELVGNQVSATKRQQTTGSVAPSKKHSVLVGNQVPTSKHRNHAGNAAPAKQRATSPAPSPKKPSPAAQPKTSEPLITGTVTYVDLKKGYGYIKDGDGTSYYINRKALEYAHESDWEISKGDKVSFTVYISKKGTHCANNLSWLSQYDKKTNPNH